jgi:DNA-nicking Smr family endonuclease
LLLCQQLAADSGYVMSQSQNEDDNKLFKKTVVGTIPLHQDKVRLKKPSAQSNRQSKKHAQMHQAVTVFEFSDGYQAYFEEDNPLSYTKYNGDRNRIRRLGRGDYPPDVLLDLHGMNKSKAKCEIAFAIDKATKEENCILCVIHGLGGYVLKRAVPSWLVQHPDVLGFHQAPLTWGGQGALFVLLNTRNGLISKAMFPLTVVECETACFH